MNLLSWILLTLIGLWFAGALFKMLRNRGKARCGVAGDEENNARARNCTGCCTTCGRCKR